MGPQRQSIDVDKARGGEVVPRTPWRRVVFPAVLAGAVMLGVVLVVSRYWH